MTGKKRGETSYWGKRIRSKEFRQRLTAALAEEIEQLGRARVAEVIDARRVRDTIRRAEPGFLDAANLADLVMHVNERAAQRLRARKESVARLLDRDLMKRIDAILDEEFLASGPIQDFIVKSMQQEFFQRLFTDIIYTSIVQFNQRINPVFGSFAVVALEDQIKGFIRWVMPMVEKEAMGFATSRANREILFDFSRSMFRHLVNEPVASYVGTTTARQREKLVGLLRESIGNHRLQSQMSEVAATLWDDVYDRIRDRRVVELVRVDRQAAWLAERLAEVILPVLQRPSVLALVTEEVTRATAAPVRPARKA